MIKIKDDYVILVDEAEYTAAIDKHKTDKKGYPIYKVLGYYSTFDRALKGIYEYMVRIGLQEKDYTLPEAIEYLTKMNDEMKSLIEKRAMF